MTLWVWVRLKTSFVSTNWSCRCLFWIFYQLAWLNYSRSLLRVWLFQLYFSRFVYQPTDCLFFSTHCCSMLVFLTFLLQHLTDLHFEHCWNLVFLLSIWKSGTKCPSSAGPFFWHWTFVFHVFLYRRNVCLGM